MRQSMNDEQQVYRGYAAGEGLHLHEQERFSDTYHYKATPGEKVFEIPVRRLQRILVAVLSFIAWCLFAFTILIAYGVANVSPSPAASSTQILLVVGLLLFTVFVVWANILFNTLQSKKRLQQY